MIIEIGSVTGAILEVMRLKLCLEVNGYVHEGSLWLKRTLVLDGAK